MWVGLFFNYELRTLTINSASWSSIFPLLQWQTLYIVVLYSKSYVHLTKVGKVTVFSTTTHRRLAHLHMPPSTLAADSISLTAEAPYLAADTNFLHGQEKCDYSVWWATLTSEDFTDAGDDRSVFEDLVQAHLTPLVDLSWCHFKNLDMCHILCSSHKFIYWRKPFDTGCSVLYQTRRTSPTRQFRRLGPCRAMLQNDSMLSPHCDIFVKFNDRCNVIMTFELSIWTVWQEWCRFHFAWQQVQQPQPVGVSKILQFPCSWLYLKCCQEGR